MPRTFPFYANYYFTVDGKERLISFSNIRINILENDLLRKWRFIPYRGHQSLSPDMQNIILPLTKQK